MKHFRLAFVGLLFIVAGAGAAYSQDTIGTMAFTQGKVEVVRDGKVLSGKGVFNGMTLRNYDQVKVPKGGQAEVKINPKTGIDATIKIGSSSAITLDITSLKKNQKGSVELIGGNIELKVAKLTTGNALNVKTGTATMGVRGTTFAVTIAPSGENLLTTESGRVACTVQKTGEEFYSEPGNVVESSSDGVWNNNDVDAGGLEAFRNSWINTKVEAFRVDPARALTQQGNLFEKSLQEFNAAYKELSTKRDIITRWIKLDQTGNLGSTRDQIRDKNAMKTPLFKLRKAQNSLERINARIFQLYEYLPGTAIVGTLDSGISLDKFLTSWQAAQVDLSVRNAEVWYITRLYAARNEGSFPLDEFESGFSSSDDFFSKP